MEVVALKQYQKYIMSSTVIGEFSQSLGIRKKVFFTVLEKVCERNLSILHMNAEKLEH